MFISLGERPFFFYYDVNSATRPYVMKEIPMPIGPARWNVNLINQ